MQRCGSKEEYFILHKLKETQRGRKQFNYIQVNILLMSCLKTSVAFICHAHIYPSCGLYITLIILFAPNTAYISHCVFWWLRKQGLKFTWYNFQEGSGHSQFISETKEQIALPFFNPSANLLLNIISALPAVNLIPNSSCVAVSLAGVKPQLLPSFPGAAAL